MEQYQPSQILLTEIHLYGIFHCSFLQQINSVLSHNNYYYIRVARLFEVDWVADTVFIKVKWAVSQNEYLKVHYMNRLVS